ncbi:MAG: DUF5309 domain-containing protein, partial [Cetobacterium sp.]
MIFKMAMENMKKTKDLLPGEVQDLADIIVSVSPKDTPLTTLLLSMGNTTKATDITVSWREKELNATQTGLKVEGAEAGDPLKSTRKMFTNYCQIMERVYAVSGTLSALNPKGIGDETANEIADRLTELKRDMEHYYINGVKAEESGATPRQMNGLINLIASANTVDMSNKKVTEEAFLDAMQKMWDKGCNGDVYVFCNATEKRDLNALLSKATYTRVQATTHNKLGIIVDSIETDFGTCNIVLNRHMPKGQFLGVDLSMVEIADLRPVFEEKLAKTGDYVKGHVVVETSIKLFNQY